MQEFSQAQAERVWQRVKGQSGSPSLEELIANTWENAGAYYQLSRRGSAACRKLYEQERGVCATARGLHAVLTGKTVPLPRTAPVQGSQGETLRACFRREMQALRFCDGRCADPEYGPLFRDLRTQLQSNCRQLLQLIGEDSK